MIETSTRAGIILVAFNDLFSKVTSLICSTKYTSIGFYYNSSIDGNYTTNINLYNIWEPSLPQ